MVVLVSLYLGTLLVHLLEHFHEHLGPNDYLLHSFIVLADVVALVITEECTVMADLFLACDTDKLISLTMVTADTVVLLQLSFPESRLLFKGSLPLKARIRLVAVHHGVQPLSLVLLVDLRHVTLILAFIIKSEGLILFKTHSRCPLNRASRL